MFVKKLLLLSTITLSTLFFSFQFGGKPSLKSALKTLQGFCNYVPSGTAIVEGDTATVQAFYMSNEITNLQYNEFLYHLKKNRLTEQLKIAQVDSNAWNTSFDRADMKTMAQNYHTHPAYHEFPAVNISKEAAELFCVWLTDVYDSISNGELKIKFRLPLRSEYMRAARGDNHKRVYTWEGTTLLKKNGKVQYQGQVQANCIANGAESIARNSETGELEFTKALYPEVDFTRDGAFITAPSESYWPNDFGFYNINGNVSEMIADGPFAVGGDWYSPGYDVRNESIKPFNSPHPTVGFRVVATYMEPEK